MCVCVYVCVCVCVWQRSCSNGCVDFAETLHKRSDRYFLVSFFSIFENSNLMTSWRPFCSFPMGHSHGRNFALIFFKFEYKVQSCSLLFAIWNEQNQFTTFHAITEQKIKISSKNKILELGQEMYHFILIQTRWKRIWNYFFDLLSNQWDRGGTGFQSPILLSLSTLEIAVFWKSRWRQLQLRVFDEYEESFKLRFEHSLLFWFHTKTQQAIKKTPYVFLCLCIS